MTILLPENFLASQTPMNFEPFQRTDVSTQPFVFEPNP
jgi:hypothetical protein